MDGSVLFDRWRQRVLLWGHIGATWRIRLNLCILHPLESTTEMPNRSVQPCLHRWLRSVPILYNGLPVVHSKLPLPMLACRRHVIRGSLGPPESGAQMATYLIDLAVFSGLTSMTDWQSDRQTDSPGYSVRCGVIMRNYVGHGKATHSFHVSTNNFATI